MVALIIEEFEDRIIGWLCDVTNSFWLNVLGGVILGLIVQVAASPVTICGKFIDKKAMQIIFCSVLTINHIANKLSSNLKDIMRIKRETPSDPLTLAHVKTHNYDQDSNEDNIKILSLSPFSSTIYLLAFIRLAHDTDNISYKLFMAPLVHQACAKNSQNKLQKEHSNTLGEQAIYHVFPYKAHYFLCYCNLSIVVMDQIAIE